MNFTLIGEVAESSSHTQTVTSVALQSTGDGLTAFSVSLDRTLVAWKIGKPGAVDTVRLPTPSAVSGDIAYRRRNRRRRRQQTNADRAHDFAMALRFARSDWLATTRL